MTFLSYLYYVSLYKELSKYFLDYLFDKKYLLLCFKFMTFAQANFVYSFKTQEETMDTQKVSFKVVLNSQIRRFTISQDVSTSLDYLKEKLSTMFVKLHQKDFRYMFVSVNENVREKERKQKEV